MSRLKLRKHKRECASLTCATLSYALQFGQNDTMSSNQSNGKALQTSAISCTDLVGFSKLPKTNQQIIPDAQKHAMELIWRIRAVSENPGPQ